MWADMEMGELVLFCDIVFIEIGILNPLFLMFFLNIKYFDQINEFLFKYIYIYLILILAIDLAQ